MDKKGMMALCLAFFEELSNELPNYTVVGSSNNDSSLYLVPTGTEDEITYYGKPANSFRISDHWNWYANTKKCDNERYIQCLCVDLPYAKKREAPGKASKPIYACTVSMIGHDGKYHQIFGEKFDRKTKTWKWVETDLSDVVRRMNNVQS